MLVLGLLTSDISVIRFKTGHGVGVGFPVYYLPPTFSLEDKLTGTILIFQNGD